MTIKEAIAYLRRIAEKHGEETEVFFDCPNCERSFAPNTVQTAAVHLKATWSPRALKGQGAYHV
jgi:hypothetical protein